MLIATTSVHVPSSIANKQIPVLARILFTERFKEETVVAEEFEEDE